MFNETFCHSRLPEQGETPTPLHPLDQIQNQRQRGVRENVQVY